MPDKLEQLTAMLEKQPNDAFLLYAVGMEHKKRSDPAKAIEFFTRVSQVDPNYCYAYYQLGQVYEQQGETESARGAYRAGIDAALRTNDAHARSELETALAMIE